MAKFNPNDHLMSLKGKDYLQVMWRLVWFRDDKPEWGIDTIMVDYNAETRHAVFKAIITDENGVQKSAGYGSESAKDFGDFIEKAETKAVGRALAMLGYGTQFAPELDEEARIVDSPVQRKQPKPLEILIEAGADVRCESCGNIITETTARNGSTIKVIDLMTISKRKYGRCYCAKCMKEKENK